MSAIIEIKNLHKSYRMSRTNVVKALDGVSLTINKGDFTAIVGPSGCGKSTLLHIMGILDQPDEGAVLIEGEDVSTIKERKAARMRAQKIGFVFQGFNLIPTLTALENVALAAKYGGMKASQRRSKAMALMKKMGLEERINHKPNELSGGQQQRVALARALINEPSLILADEPTGELDSKTALEIMDMLKKFNREEGRTFVIVTHNDDVARACKKIVRMQDGKIVG